MAKYFLHFGHRAVAVSPGTMEIGRGEQCELRLDDPRVSRHHAIMYFDVAGLRIRDISSHNGVFVNGRRVQGTAVLQAGDQVMIGSEAFEVREGEEGPGRPTEKLTRPAVDHAVLGILSRRERQVFDLLVRGHPHREIGEKLGLSTKTVETYRNRISEKLGARTRAELVALALREGALSSSSE